MRRRFELADALILVGLILLTVGLALFDWRLAVTVLGVVLLAGGLWLSW